MGCANVHNNNNNFHQSHERKVSLGASGQWPCWGPIGGRSLFKTRGLQFLCTLVLTICKDSTVSMRGVRAKAHIAGNRESWEGFSNVPHLSTNVMGLIFYTPLSSLFSLSLSATIQQPFVPHHMCQIAFLFHLCLCFFRNFS